jgi:hypothetical protein
MPRRCRRSRDRKRTGAANRSACRRRERPRLSPVPEADEVGGLDRLEELAGLLGADLGGLTLDGRVAFGPDAGGRVVDDDVADDQQVEELPERRQAELLGRGRQLEAGQVVADVVGGDPDERNLPVGVVALGKKGGNLLRRARLYGLSRKCRGPDVVLSGTG